MTIYDFFVAGVTVIYHYTFDFLVDPVQKKVGLQHKIKCVLCFFTNGLIMLTFTNRHAYF